MLWLLAPLSPLFIDLIGKCSVCVCGLSLYLCAGVCYVCVCVFGTSRGNFGSMCPKNSGEKLLGRYVIYTTSTKTILLHTMALTNVHT